MNSDSEVDDIEERPDEIYEELVNGNEIYDQVVHFPNDVKYQDFAVHWRIFFYTMINMLYFYQYFHFNIIVREYPVKIRSNAEGLRWCKFMNCSCNSFLKIIDQIIIDAEQERKSRAKDRRYIEKISNLLETISQSKISILTQVHTIPSLPVSRSRSINRSTKSQLVPEDLATQLYIFYQLTLFDGFKKEDFFSNKNTHMFEKIYNSLDDCNNFVKDYVKSQKNSQDVLNKWHKVQVFLMDFFNNGNDNSPENGTNTDDFINDLYSLVYDDYEAKDEIEMYLNCNITLCQEAFELNQENAIRQFIILLLGTPFNIKLDINENKFQVDLRICWKRLIYSSKIMFNYHQYQYLNLLIIDSKIDNTLVSNIQCEKIKNYSNNINTLHKFLVLLLEEYNKFRIECFENENIKQDCLYAEKFIGILTKIRENRTPILSSFSSKTKLNLHLDDKTTKNDGREDYNVRLHHLYHLYKMANKDKNNGDFRSWCKRTVMKIMDNLPALNDFIEKYLHRQCNSKDVLLMWKLIISMSKSRNARIDQYNDKETIFSSFIASIQGSENFITTFEDKVEELYVPYPSNEIFKMDDDDTMRLFLVLLLDADIDTKTIFDNKSTLDIYHYVKTFCKQMVLVAVQVLNYWRTSYYNCLIDKSKKEAQLEHRRKCLIENYNHVISLTDNLLDLLNKYKTNFDNIKNVGNTYMKQLRIDDMYLINLRDVLRDIVNKRRNILASLPSIPHSPRTKPKSEEESIVWNLYFLHIFISISYNSNSTPNDFLSWFTSLKNNIYEQICNGNFSYGAIQQLTHDQEEFDRIAKLLQDYKTDCKGDSVEDSIFSRINELINTTNYPIFQELDNLSKFQHCLNISGELSLEKNDLIQLYAAFLLNTPMVIDQELNVYYWILSHNATAILNFYQFSTFDILDNCKLYRDRKQAELFLKQSIKVYQSLVILNQYLGYYKVLEQKQEDKSDLKCFQTYRLDDIFVQPKELHILSKNSESVFNSIWILKWYLLLEMIEIEKFNFDGFETRTKFIIDQIKTSESEIDEFIKKFNKTGNADFTNDWNLFKVFLQNPKSENVIRFEIVGKIYKGEDGEELDKVKHVMKRITLERVSTHKNSIKLDAISTAKIFLLVLFKAPLNKFRKKDSAQVELDKLINIANAFSRHDPETIKVQMPLGKCLTTVAGEFVGRLTCLQPQIKDDEASISNSNKKFSLQIKSKFDKVHKNFAVDRIKDFINTYQNIVSWPMIILKLLISFLPLVDIILDLVLAYQFYQTNDINYFILTIGILIVTGIASIFTERQLTDALQWQPVYYVNILNYAKIRVILSFFQITLFFRTLNETCLYVKRKKQPLLHSCMDYINYGDMDFWRKQTQTMKYVEVCCEAIPQIILQIYIVIVSQRLRFLQMLSITSALFSINLTVWGYLSTRDITRQMSFWRHPKVIVREFCFYALRIMSTSLILSKFSLMEIFCCVSSRFVFALIIETIVVNDISKSFGVLQNIYSDLFELKVYNIITFFEFLIYFALCLAIYIFEGVHNIYYFAMCSYVYPTLLFIWFVILIWDKFESPKCIIGAKEENDYQEQNQSVNQINENCENSNNVTNENQVLHQDQNLNEDQEYDDDQNQNEDQQQNHCEMDTVRFENESVTLSRCTSL